MYRIPVYKVKLVKDSTQALPFKSISGARSAAGLLAGYLAGSDREHLVALMLDVRGHVIGIHTVSIGTISQAVAHPREVFKAAILGNAHSIILGHNHPSGNPEPSPDDIEVTRDLVHAGRLLQIEVLDHIIVGEGKRFVSLAERGYMTGGDAWAYAPSGTERRLLDAGAAA